MQNGGTTTTKHSMLDKLKLFNKEKSDKSKSSQISKRTSSSSGFSSARSERSDSSLSLNDGQQPSHQHSKSTNKKCNGDVGGKTSKTKLLASKSVTKDNSVSNKINKTDKKDKSPARKTDDVQTESKISNSKLQKIAASKGESKLKPLSQNNRKIETKPSLIQPPKPIAPQTITNSTGIPKPMAAIKGTSKVPLDRNLVKDDSNDFNKTTKDSTISASDISTSTDHDQMRQAHFVSPITQNNSLPSMTDSSHSNSTHSASTGLNSNSSESSVIYRPSSESGSEALSSRLNGTNSPLKSNPIPNRKIDQYSDIMMNEGSDRSGSIMSPNKFNTVSGSKLVASTIYEEDKQQMTILPMRPLLRGYTSHVTLPTRGLRGHGHHNMISDYIDEIGQGYCSDGDALRKPPIRFSDIDNGYLSEGGLSREGKHYLSILRGRALLPPTIEER